MYHIAYGYLAGGGAFNGAYLAGVQVALVETGLHRALSGVIGVSTSIPALGYLLAAKSGDHHQHFFETTTYSVEARSRSFVKWYGRLDMAWLRGVFEGSTGKPIHYQRLASSGVRYVGVVTDWETGLPHYIEPHSQDEFFTLIEAGCSIPGLTSPVAFRGRLMTDSMASDSCPVSWLMSLPVEERPTHILIVTNSWQEPLTREKQIREWQLLRFAFGRSVPKRIINGFALRHRRFYREVAVAQTRADVQVAVEWLPWKQKPLNRNPRRIEDLTQAGYERFRMLLKMGDH